MPPSQPKSTTPHSITFTAIPDFPHIKPGDNIARIILKCLSKTGITLQAGDTFVVAHKIVSKAEGRLVNLDDVQPGDKAFQVAAQTQKDPRLVELILRESVSISRMQPGLLIVTHRLGFTSANAGIDRSNAPQEVSGETVVLLPENPDQSAGKMRQEIFDQTGLLVGILIADSHGRPFRLGTVGVAIGVAGLPALWDRRGEHDLYGYQLQHTEVGTADELAAAASLLMGQAAEGTPVIHVHGLTLPPIEGRASDLVRPQKMDLYR